MNRYTETGRVAAPVLLIVRLLDQVWEWSSYQHYS
jgi:hypothetical protein